MMIVIPMPLLLQKSRWMNCSNNELKSSDLHEEILGYLNFSNGKPEAKFQSKFNRFYEYHCDVESSVLPRLRSSLKKEIARLKKKSSVFRETSQVESVIDLALEKVPAAYRAFHKDLLFHLNARDFEHIFFLVRIIEATLEQGGPWDEEERIVAGAISKLNDFVGYRPVAILENERNLQAYDHEWFRPVPIYLKDVGVAYGCYSELLRNTFDILRRLQPDILEGSYVDVERIDELAVDVRAHDHLHPVNKRTNYMFGEWDPHLIDTKGFYRRFIMRKFILDSLLRWIDRDDGQPKEERLYDASVVLCGTILMASAISGSGPLTHSSEISLSGLLPDVARQRDLFYEFQMSQLSGERRKRIEKLARATKQPFGHIRQHLNTEMAQHGARQVEAREIAGIYARIGFFEESRTQTATIPTLSTRFETEIICHVSSLDRDFDHGRLENVYSTLAETYNEIQSGIHCGAIVDPWNILGFQGHFPLFQSREDSIPDHRVEFLLAAMRHLFHGYSRGLGEAEMTGDEALAQRFRARLFEIADEWDRYASSVVDELPRVVGQELSESAVRVSGILSAWRKAGEQAGDISFWRERVEELPSADAFSQVVSTLLEKNDLLAAKGLLMHWLSMAEETGLDADPYPLPILLVSLFHRTLEEISAEDSLHEMGRFFDYLQANAETMWVVPTLEESVGDFLDLDDDEGEIDEGGDWNEESDIEEGEFDETLYEAAYEGVIYRDSAEDGFQSDTLDEGYGHRSTEFEEIAKTFEPKIRFLESLASLWQMAALKLASLEKKRNSQGVRPKIVEQSISSWENQIEGFLDGLRKLLGSLEEFEIIPPDGSSDANIEYDSEMYAKQTLQSGVIQTLLKFQEASRYLQASRTENNRQEKSAGRELVTALYRGVLRRDVSFVRRLLPRLISQFLRKPILYVGLDRGGSAVKVLSAKNRQMVLMFFFTRLPALGMFRETWQLLQLVYKMERRSKPEGVAVTEFDRLFKAALRSVLETVVRSTNTREFRDFKKISIDSFGPNPDRKPRLKTEQCDVSTSSPSVSFSQRQLAQIENRPQQTPSIYSSSPISRSEKKITSSATFHRDDENLFRTQLNPIRNVIEKMSALWKTHSRSIRISTVESLHNRQFWDEVKSFIEEYGEDFFHAQLLIPGNVRAILQMGVDEFLRNMEENRDPLENNKLLDAISAGTVDRDRAEFLMETVLEAVLDNIDRFVEYNSTTTQSDYGEKFYCFLDFLRVEAKYDRDEWNIQPYILAHEVLSKSENLRPAEFWAKMLENLTAKRAAKHQRALERLEKQYAFGLPGVTDRISERFVRSLSLNSLKAIIPAAIRDAATDSDRIKIDRNIGRLKQIIDEYQQATTGSAIDVPEWLRNIEQEIDKSMSEMETGFLNADSFSAFSHQALSPYRLQRELDLWDEEFQNELKNE